MRPGSPLSRAVIGALLLAACQDTDPLDGVTQTGPSGGPSGGPGGGPSGGPGGDMTEGTDSTTTDGTTDGATEPTTTEGTTGPTTGEPTTTGSTGETGAGFSHALDIQPIWDANCVNGCHTTGGTGATWFILSGGSAYESLVGAQSVSFPGLTLVTPGDAEASYLWHKINNTHFEFGGGGTQMPPPPASMLPADDLGTIAAWIDGGCAP